MNIYLNGEDFETTSETIDQLVREKDLKADGLVVEVNLKIIKKENWNKVKLNQDDKIELVTFVGGG